MAYLGDYDEDYIDLNFKFTTRTVAGVPFTLAGSPVISVYKSNGTVESVAGITLTTDFDGVTGLNNVKINLSADAFYAAVEDYQVVVTAGTVNGVSVVGETVAEFSIENRFMRGTDNGLTDKAGFSLSATGLDAIVSTATGMVEIAKAIWDRVLTGATHNLSTSAGRRLRGIQEFQGYEGGAIWINTVSGTAGTLEYENGTVENPVDTIADANTLAASLGFSRFEIASGSTITFAAAQLNQLFQGSNWTLALGGQNIAGSLFIGATVSGTGVAATETRFVDCELGTMTIGLLHTDNCVFTGTITFSTAGDYKLCGCHSGVAGNSTPIIDMGAGLANVNLTMPDYQNGIEIRNLNAAGTDLFSISGIGQIIYAASCSGTVNQRGSWKVTNTGGVTIVADDNTTNLKTITGPTGAILDPAATSPQLVDDVLDEVNTGAAHNVTNSLGRQIRETRETNVYAGGQIWVDTVNGAAGTTNYENGTVDNPVDSIADARTLSISLNIKRFVIAPGSSITLAAAFTGYVFDGDAWTLALGGQAVSGTIFKGATVSGVCTGANAPEFHNCILGAITVPSSHYRECNLGATITAGSAGDFFFERCHSAVAGAGSPVFDFGAAIGNINLNMRSYSGGIDIRNMGQTGTDNMSLEGWGQLVINANCVGGTIVYRGAFELTNNGSGLTITADDNTTLLAALNDLSPAEVFTQVNGAIDTAISELSQAKPTATPSLRTGLMLIYMALRNKLDVDATSKEIHNDAGVVIAKKALSDDGTTYVEDETESGP